MAQDLGVSQHVATVYPPAPRGQRTGRVLCLSGGGSQASLYPLGTLRRLNEPGILSGLDTITPVSGGSIIAAHLATKLGPWPGAGTVTGNWTHRVAEPFWGLVAKKIRTGPILRCALARNWLRNSKEVETLAGRHREDLSGLMLSDLPARPKVACCATDMALGLNRVSERTRAGDFRAGCTRDVPSWALARAVTTSSCFPPVYNPLPTTLSPDALRGGDVVRGRARDDCVRGFRLTDGGNYDNLGLELVWDSRAAVLVSARGRSIRFRGGQAPALEALAVHGDSGLSVAGAQEALAHGELLSAAVQRRVLGIGGLVENYQSLPEARYSGGS